MREHPRPLDRTDIDAFFEAAEGRPAPKSAAAAKADFLERVRRDYPWRMKRLNRDLKWLRKLAEKEAKATGMGIEDVRWWFR